MAIKFSIEQQTAIDSKNKNIIISAGAGSGKTAVLTERIRQTLRRGVRVDQLLVLTFTNAAAAEMKERITKAMAKDEMLKDRTAEVDSAYITTFDSFSLSIVKKYHDRLNLTKNIAIVDSSVLNVKKRQFIDEIFFDYYLNDNEKFTRLVFDLTTKDDTLLKNEILKLSNKIEQRSDRDTYLKNFIVTFYSLEKFNKYMQEYLNIIFNKINDIKNNLEEIKLYLDEKKCSLYYGKYQLLLASKTYDDVYNFLSNRQSSIRLDGQAKIIHEKNKMIIDELKELCIYSNVDFIKQAFFQSKQYVEIIIEILNKYYKKIDKYKFSHNAFEFIDISKMAINLVKENKDIKNELRDTFVEILVDEYQDTNDLQEEFISYISKNNVYMVGDIKQSIYGFRNANPMIFKEKYDAYKNNNGGIKIDLNQNFRSNRMVLFIINQIFDRIMDDNIGQAKFKEEHEMKFGLQAYDKGGNENKIKFATFNYCDEIKEKYKIKEIEMFYILNDIKRKIGNKEQIYDKESGAFRECDYKDFAILAADSSSFESISELLSYNHIPNLVFKNVEVNKGVILHIIKNIFKLIAFDYSKIYNSDFLKCFYSVGRSFIYQYSDEELFDFIVNNTYFESKLYSDLNGFSKLVDKTSLHDLAILFIDKLNICNKLIELGDIEDNLTRIEYILKIIDSIDKLQIDIFEFVKCFDDILENQEKMEFPASGINENKVKIMTIHKSKGLEYPIVYFIGNSKIFNKSDLKEKFIYDNKYGIIAPFYIDGIGGNIHKILMKNNYNKSLISEKIRLLYVALTRAREQIIIVCENKTIEDDYSEIISTSTREKYNSFSSIYNSIKTIFNNYKEIIDIESLNINDQYLKTIKKDYKSFILPTSLKIIHKENKVESQIIEKESASKDIKTILKEEEIKAMEYGTYIHGIFEACDFIKPDYTGLSNKEKTYLTNFINQPILKNIKNAKIYKEYEFIQKKENGILHGIIDLMIEYLDYIDIIDYKLSHIEDKDYINQLNKYRKYIQEKTNKKVNIYLYSIIKNNIVKVEEK